MPDLEVIIGLEVHAQMNTKTKMFCSCDNDAFGKPPNTTVCPICMGHPGTLPAPNREAVQKAMKAAAALKCEIAKENHLDRKNYFYPDLPMGYQISQYDFPLAKGGVVEFSSLRGTSAAKRREESRRGQNEQLLDLTAQGAVSLEENKQKCRLTRLHIENDAGKLTHAGGRSYCDYNRAGTPLMEIVTEPDLRSPDDAVAFVKELQRILITVDASEADMYKGMMRFDASISLRPKGEKKLYPRAEIKNLNSFKSLEKALSFEIKRIAKLWEEGTPPEKEVTVHWDDDKEVGVILREKESAADYRYFPEPDIPPLEFDEAALALSAQSVGELPDEKKARYLSAGLDEAQAMLLTGNPRLAEFYDEVLRHTNDQKRASAVVLTQLLGFLKSSGKELAGGPSASAVIDLLSQIDAGNISANMGKEVLGKMVESGKNASNIIEAEGLGTIANVAELKKIVQEAIQKNPKACEDFRAGKERAASAIIGYVMGKTKGQADPKIVSELVHKLV